MVAPMLWLRHRSIRASAVTNTSPASWRTVRAARLSASSSSRSPARRRASPARPASGPARCGAVGRRRACRTVVIASSLRPALTWARRAPSTSRPAAPGQSSPAAPPGLPGRLVIGADREQGPGQAGGEPVPGLIAAGVSSSSRRSNSAASCGARVVSAGAVWMSRARAQPSPGCPAAKGCATLRASASVAASSRAASACSAVRSAAGMLHKRLVDQRCRNASSAPGPGRMRGARPPAGPQPAPTPACATARPGR